MWSGAQLLRNYRKGFLGAFWTHAFVPYYYQGSPYDGLYLETEGRGLGSYEWCPSWDDIQLKVNKFRTLRSAARGTLRSECFVCSVTNLSYYVSTGFAPACYGVHMFYHNCLQTLYILNTCGTKQEIKHIVLFENPYFVYKKIYLLTSVIYLINLLIWVTIDMIFQSLIFEF